MQTEIEAKWLGIDIEEIRQHLKSIGATLITAERMMIRSVYDYPDNRLDKIAGWIRVRDEGDKITMSYKQLNERTLHGTKEISVTVDSFGGACDFLQSIGLIQKSYQETKRESWKLGGTEIELDTWPWVPSLIEIEAKDEAELWNVADKLGLDRNDALFGSVEVVYQAVYDVTEVEANSWPEIRFSPVPAWLEAKRRDDQTMEVLLQR